MGGICANDAVAGVHTESESLGVLQTGNSELPVQDPAGALRGYQPCGLNRTHLAAGCRPARQAMASMSARQGLDGCDHNDGDVSEACCARRAASPPTPRGERRRRRCGHQPASGGEGKAHSREQRRWSEGPPSSPTPRTPPSPLGATRVSYTCSSAMLDCDEGARRYYLCRSASEERATITAAAFATGREGAAEAVSLSA